MSDVYVCIYISKQVRKTRGLGGCSPKTFFEIRCSEIASGGILDKRRAVEATILAVLHASAKPADFKFPREKALRLAEQ